MDRNGDPGGKTAASTWYQHHVRRYTVSRTIVGNLQAELTVEALAHRAGMSPRSFARLYKQRTGLAQALIHDPDILILDEPTSGLDPLQILGIRDLIRSLAGSKTIIFSTHILQEVGPVTDRVVIINEGGIIADGNLPPPKRSRPHPPLPSAGGPEPPSRR